MQETAAHNRRYKDSVFVDLFSTDEKAKERFLSLYNALHGTELPLYCPVEKLKLDNTGGVPMNVHPYTFIGGEFCIRKTSLHAGNQRRPCQHLSGKTA